MLHTISQLYTKYVRSDRVPPHNIFIEQAAYQQFLRTTQDVAASAQVIVDQDSQALPDVQDCNMFLWVTWHVDNLNTAADCLTIHDFVQFDCSEIWSLLSSSFDKAFAAL